MTTKQDIQNAIAALTREFNDAVAKRDKLNLRIMQLEQNLRGLKQLRAKDILGKARERQAHEAVGLTEAIRTVMRTEQRPMTAGEVKTALAMAGFDLGKFSNASSAVHNTLIRMAQAEQIKYSPEAKTYSLHFSALYGGYV